MKTEEKKCYQQAVLEIVSFAGADQICTSNFPNDLVPSAGAFYLEDQEF